MPESLNNTETPRKKMSSSERLLMLVLLAVLTAMEIVLSRFLSINTWNLKIGFSFVPVVVASMLYGPMGGACVAGLGDFLGATLFPIAPFFPGYTLTAVLTGLVFGLLLYKKQTPIRAGLAVGINQLVFSLVLNTFWIFLTNMDSSKAAPYFTILTTRIPQCAILIPVQFAAILLIGPALRRIKKSFL